MTRYAPGLLLALAVAAPAAGCKDENKVDPGPSGTGLDEARTAVLQSVAALPGLPKTVQFRGVQAYKQAVGQRVAVCGLVSAFADDPNIFVPFVSVANPVTPPETRPPRYDFDTHVGTSTGEASRVYQLLVADCWVGGGPAPGRPPALPPLPDTIADPRFPATPAAPDPPRPDPSRVGPRVSNGPVAGQTPADGSVTMRQSANVHNGPGGPSVRTVQQGASLHVFATAPGGWYQVGDTAPIGWVHESMLNR